MRNDGRPQGLQKLVLDALKQNTKKILLASLVNFFKWVLKSFNSSTSN